MKENPANTPDAALLPHGAGIPAKAEDVTAVRSELPGSLHAGPAGAAHQCVAPANARRRPQPAWSSPREACALIARGYTLRTGAVVASVVGTVLSGVNEGAVIASGRIDAVTWVRVATNYLVPFVVASVGYLAPLRQRHRTPR